MAGTLEAVLDAQAAERERRLLDVPPPGPRLKPMPPGFRAEDFASPFFTAGFVTLRRAAEQMNCPERKVVELVNRGLLEAEISGGVLYVRPALVTVLHVRDRRDG